MGLWDALAGGSSKQASTFDQKESGTTSQKAVQTGSATTTTLDPATIGILQGVIKQLAPGVAGGSPDADMIRQLSGQLATNLDPAAVQNNIDTSFAAAQQVFNQNQGAQISGLQQQIGSTGNSFAQLIEGQGDVELSTMLAKLASDIQLNASSQHAGELGAAIEGLGRATAVGESPLRQLLSAISTLSGAQTTQESEATSLVDVISNIQKSGTSTTKGKSTPGVIPTIVSLTT